MPQNKQIHLDNRPQAEASAAAAAPVVTSATVASSFGSSAT